MSRIDEIFAARRAAGRKVLVAYLCIGDPSVDESIELSVAAAQAGADILEIGVPFSDPTADGPVIARASERAIKNGGSLRAAFDAASRIRARIETPLVVFGYYNPIYIYGERAAVATARASGVDGLLVVDLPPEEGVDLRTAAAEARLPIIPLLTPTSGPERVRAAVGRASGFIYYVSVTGVTGGAGEGALGSAGREAARLRQQTGLPVVVGFGIDGPEKARLAVGLAPAVGEVAAPLLAPPLGEGAGQASAGSDGADGIAVGTAVVRAIENGADRAQRGKNVRTLIERLRAALDQP